MWRGVLNNSLFQVPERSSQINFPSSWAQYIFRAHAAHVGRQAAVKVLQPTAVYWINGISRFPWGVGRGKKQLPKHSSHFSYITELYGGQHLHLSYIYTCETVHLKMLCHIL